MIRQAHALPIMIMIVLSLLFIATRVAADSYEDPWQCGAQEYSSECCFPGALPLPLGVTECAPGFYCPWLNGTDTLIVACPPTPVCQLKRLASGFCPVTQGKHEPLLCPAGYLCRTSTMIEKCPAGFFCPPGSYEPKDCGGLSMCPEGSEQRLFIGALLIAGLADAVLLAAVAIYRRIHKQAHAKQLQAMRSQDEVSLSKGGVVVAPHLSRATRKLCKGFHQAKGELKQMDFEFTNLSMKLPNDKMILTGVTGRVAPGKVTAIMGPSGAGKTTFLYTLTGKMDASCVRGGELSINGEQAELSAFKKVVGYVPQDDVMIRELNVWDNIMHSARIRLPHWSQAEVDGHVRAVIEAMGLVEVSGIKIGDETSRGISGGQRKRVNIGMELAAAPLALFLDEPTSGLDATAAMDVCNLLRDIAQETGITVAMVIHQPRVEIWNHLDDILLLAPGGRTVFLGPQSKAQRYFESHLAVEVHAHENPADVIMDSIAQSGDAFAKQWVLTGRDYLSKMADVPLMDGKDNGPILRGLGDDDVHNVSKTQAPPMSSRVSAGGSGSGDIEPRTTVLYPSPAAAIAADQQHRNNTNSNGSSALVGHRGSHGSTTPHNNGTSLIIEMVGTSEAKKQVKSISGTSGAAAATITLPAPQKHGDSQVTIVARELRGAPFAHQFALCHIRSLKQQHEKLSALVLESGVAMLAGFLMGVGGGQPHQGVLISPYTLLSPAPLSFLIPQMCMFINMAIGLAASSPGVKAFGEEKIVYWREAGAGHSRLAYFLGVSTASFYRIALSALHFTMVYHLLAQPLISFGNMFAMIILTFYAVYGLAAAISMVLKREDAPLLAVVASLFAAVFGGYVESLPMFLKQISYAFWASEAMYDQNVRPFRGIYQVDEIDAPLWDYTLGQFGLDLVLIAVIGTIYRIIAYILMIALHRDKQR